MNDALSAFDIAPGQVWRLEVAYWPDEDEEDD